MRTRQYRKPRHAHKVFLVVCEGETEREYVEALKRHFRVPVAIKTRVSWNALSMRLIRQYVAELNVGSDEEYSIFYIYDEDVRVVADRLRSLPGTALLSNPCIELWFLLHVKEQTRHIDADTALKSLRNSHACWSKYSKGVLDSGQFQLLMRNYPSALERAKRLDPGANPSSNIYEFIELLKMHKMG